MPEEQVTEPVQLPEHIEDQLETVKGHLDDSDAEQEVHDAVKGIEDHIVELTEKVEASAKTGINTVEKAVGQASDAPAVTDEHVQAASDVRDMVAKTNHVHASLPLLDKLIEDLKALAA